MIHSTTRWLGSTATIALLVLGACPATAQTAPPPTDTKADQDGADAADIVVTAQRREERLKDVPISVTALTAQDIERGGATGTRDLSVVTPGLMLNSTGANAQPTLRGVGNTNALASAESPVSIYVDGVYIASQFASVFDLINVESIQVLKGPQGTLFGRNATGGAILMTTRTPGREFDARFRASYGSFDEVRLTGYVSTPIGDNLAADLTVGYNDDNGYSRDVLRNTRLSTYHEFNLRSKIVFTPTSSTSILLTGDYADLRDSTPISIRPVGLTTSNGGFVPAGARNLALTVDPASHTRGGGGSLQITQDLGGVSLKSITAYRKVLVDVLTDQDRTPLPINATAVILREHYWTQEVTLSSASNARFNWIGGLYYFGDRVSGPTLINDVPIVVPDLKTYAYAAFADGTYSVSDSLKFIAGLRYSQELRTNYATRPTGVPLTSYQRVTFKAWTPRASVVYAVSPDANIYATYSRGFKSGVFNATSFGVPAIDPETINAFEIGFKLSNRAIKLNVAGYYYDYSNLQLASRLPSGLQVTLNAANAEIYGIDADLSASLTDDLKVSVGGSWIHSAYKNFTNAPFLAPIPGAGNSSTTGDASGNPLIRTPKFSGNAALTYNKDISAGKIDASLNFYYNSGFAWTPDNNFREPSYVLLSANLGWSPIDRLRIGVWGKNLTNSLYSIARSVNTTAEAAAYARPRSFGVIAEFKY